MTTSDIPSVEQAEAALRKYQQEHDNPHFYRKDEETGGIVHWSTAEGKLRKALFAAIERRDAALSLPGDALKVPPPTADE